MKVAGRTGAAVAGLFASLDPRQSLPAQVAGCQGGEGRRMWIRR